MTLRETGERPLLPRLGLGIAVAMLSAAALSWLRFRLGGGLEIQDLDPTQDLLLGLAFAAAFATAATAYLAAVVCARGRATKTLLAFAVLVHLGAGLAVPLTSNDIFANLGYGRLMALGKNPAVTSAADLPPDDPFGRRVDPQWRERVSVYGPILNAISGACARTGDFRSAFVLFKLAMLACALATLLAAYAFSRTLDDGGARVFCLVGFNPLLAWEVSGQAHNDGVMVLAAMAFLWAAREERHWLALTLLTLGFAAKFAVAPLLLLYVLTVLRRSPVRGAAMAAAAATLVAVLFAPTWSGVATLAGPRYAGMPSLHHVVNSLGSIPLDLVGLLFPTALEPTFRLWTLVTGAILAVQAIRCAADTRDLDTAVRNALLFTLLFECLGMVWYEPWYATWVLPLAAACRDRRLAGIAALYSVLVPLLYHPTELYGLAALGSHGVALALLWNGGYLVSLRQPEGRQDDEHLAVPAA